MESDVEHYLLTAMNSGGPIAFATPLKLYDALRLAIELRDDGYVHIQLTNAETGVRLANSEQLMREWEPDA